jgi:hypothetical protein
MSHSKRLIMYVLYILCMMICIRQVKNSISQIGFQDKSDTICVYLYESILPSRLQAVEVDFNIALELSVCHINGDHNPLNNTKEVLVIQLSDDCPFIQQLMILKNTSWIRDYFAIIFSGKSKTFIF